jgi:hypothetical protein
VTDTVSDHIQKLRHAERLINDALSARLPAHAASRLLEARSAVILVRRELMNMPVHASLGGPCATE